MKLLNFENYSSDELSKIGHHFKQQSDVIKNVNNKKFAPKFVHERKIRKNQIIFDVQN